MRNENAFDNTLIRKLFDTINTSEMKNRIESCQKYYAIHNAHTLFLI